jgi:hypothetical protein
MTHAGGRDDRSLSASAARNGGIGWLRVSSACRRRSGILGSGQG